MQCTTQQELGSKCATPGDKFTTCQVLPTLCFDSGFQLVCFLNFFQGLVCWPVTIPDSFKKRRSFETLFWKVLGGWFIVESLALSVSERERSGIFFPNSFSVTCPAITAPLAASPARMRTSIVYISHAIKSQSQSPSPRRHRQRVATSGAAPCATASCLLPCGNMHLRCPTAAEPVPATQKRLRGLLFRSAAR